MDTTKYLPIGTVVLLRGATKKIMITGFLTRPKDTEDYFDYMGCIFPEGYFDGKETCLFNHTQIDKIYHFGFRDEDCVEYKRELLSKI